MPADSLSEIPIVLKSGDNHQMLKPIRSPKRVVPGGPASLACVPVLERLAAIQGDRS